MNVLTLVNGRCYIYERILIGENGLFLWVHLSWCLISGAEIVGKSWWKNGTPLEIYELLKNYSVKDRAWEVREFFSS